MPVVIDTSVTMAWCFSDESTSQTDAVLDRLRSDQAVVPALWKWEVANVLIVAERRGRLTEAQSTRFSSLLLKLPIVIDDQPADVGAVVAAGRRHGLTAYDAAYLLLAEGLGVPVATLDRRLSQACQTAGVPLAIE